VCLLRQRFFGVSKVCRCFANGQTSLIKSATILVPSANKPLNMISNNPCMYTQMLSLILTGPGFAYMLVEWTTLQTEIGTSHRMLSTQSVSWWSTHQSTSPLNNCTDIFRIAANVHFVVLCHHLLLYTFYLASERLKGHYRWWHILLYLIPLLARRHMLIS